MERVLLAQDRFAAAWYSDDEIDGVAKETPVEDLVKALVPARQPFVQRSASARRAGRTSALVPMRSRTAETSFSGSSGLARKAAAPT